MRPILHKNTLIVAEMKTGFGRLVQSFRIAPDFSSLSVETTEEDGLAQVFESQEAQAVIQSLHHAIYTGNLAESVPIQFFRTIGVQRAWTAKYKPCAKARKLKTIPTFFSRTREAALRHAMSVMEREVLGGELISLEETDDPRK